MKNNKGFVETCILLFCIASIITIVLFSEHMLELAEHKNDDKLYEEVLKCNKIKNYTYDIYLVDGHYILYDENNDLVVYTEKDNKLNKINVCIIIWYKLSRFRTIPFIFACDYFIKS